MNECRSCGPLNTAEGTPFAPWKPVSCDASQRPWRSRTVSSESLAVKTPLEIKLLQTARWHVDRAKDRKSVRISRRGAREKQRREKGKTEELAGSPPEEVSCFHLPRTTSGKVTSGAGDEWGTEMQEN